MHNLFARIGKEEYPMEDMSAEDWLRSQVRQHHVMVNPARMMMWPTISPHPCT